MIKGGVLPRSCVVSLKLDFTSPYLIVCVYEKKSKMVIYLGKLGVIYQKNDKFMFDNVKIVCHFPWSGHAIPSLPGIA